MSRCIITIHCPDAPSLEVLQYQADALNGRSKPPCSKHDNRYCPKLDIGCALPLAWRRPAYDPQKKRRQLIATVECLRKQRHKILLPRPRWCMSGACAAPHVFPFMAPISLESPVCWPYCSARESRSSLFSVCVCVVHRKVDVENDLSPNAQCLFVKYVTNINICNVSFTQCCRHAPCVNNRRSRSAVQPAHAIHASQWGPVENSIFAV